MTNKHIGSSLDEVIEEAKRKEYADILSAAPIPPQKGKMFYTLAKNHIDEKLKDHPNCSCSSWEIFLNEYNLKKPCFVSGISVNCKKCGIMHPLVFKEYLHDICLEHEFRITPNPLPFTHDELKEVVNRVYAPGNREKAFESLKETLQDEETLEVFKQLYNSRPL